MIEYCQSWNNITEKIDILEYKRELQVETGNNNYFIQKIVFSVTLIFANSFKNSVSEER